MIKIEVVLKDGKYGVIENDEIESVPFHYDTAKDAISEWEYFEKLNTNSEPNRRFLKHVSSLEFIQEVVSRYE